MNKDLIVCPKCLKEFKGQVKIKRCPWCQLTLIITDEESYWKVKSQYDN